ncbi:MAG: M60 family metallopeptidase, partial [Verrucomicrobia bacterium]|nr:M60 family metallopeptidase [Verrucomicrobiota bacterium]
YAAAARKLMPSPESPVSDPVLKELLVLENLYIQALPKAKIQSMGAHRTAAVFGRFPAGTKPINKTVALNSKENKSRGEMLSTGLYALPGKPFTVTIPQRLVGQKMVLQIGHHLDANKHNKAFVCMPQTSQKIVLTQKTTKAVNPYGGMLFLNVPKEVALDETTISFSGIIESPRFVLGQTTDAAWKTIRNHPGPWGELVGNNIIFVVHREALQALDNPTELMDWWDGNAQAHEGFYNYDIGMPLRIHTCFNPIMGFSTWPLYEKKDSIPNLLNLQRMKAYNNGLFLHEHGHHCDDGRMMFGKSGESTPNWAGYYMKGTRGDFAWKDTEETHMLRLFDSTDDLHQKMFTDGWWTTEWTHLWSYPLTSVMVGYAQAFGWEAFKTTVHRFTLPGDEINQLPAYSDRNRSDQDKMDLWLIFLSQEAKHDVRPYFAHFHITESETAGELIDKMRLPKWDAVYNPERRVIATQNQPITLTSPLQDALTYSKDLSITWTQRPVHGKLSSKNDTLTYIPEPGFTGKVDLPYSIKNTYGNESKGSIEIHIAPENVEPKLAIGTTGGVSTKKWTAITFPHRYAKPVVVASIDPEANPDFIVRIRNVKPTGCEIKLQPIRDNAKNGNTHDANWVVMESGVFTAAENGIVAEVGTVQTTPEKTSKEVEGVRKIFGDNIPMLRSACFGQVQTFNNPEWNSFFWRSDPDNLGVRVGTHFGTADDSRKKETVGYICISPGIYQFGNTVVTIGKNRIESEGTVLRTGFDCFNGWGFSKTERHFAQQ